MAHPSAPEPPPEGNSPADSDHRPPVGRTESAIATTGFHMVERILLLLVALVTVGGAAAESAEIFQTRSITLADILLMVLYTEVIGMVSAFYTGKDATFVYPIYIAITALARLIVRQSKNMAPENIVFEASAFLLLALAAVVITRINQPVDGGTAGSIGLQ